MRGRLCSRKHTIKAETQENHGIKVVGEKGEEDQVISNLRYVQEHLAKAEFRSKQG